MNAMTPITPEVSTFVFSDTFPTQYGIGHNDHAVRVVQIDGEPWFVAADVCRALGLDTRLETTPSICTRMRSKLSEIR